MREDLRIPLTMLSLHYLDKLKFKGSYKGKRFQFEKVEIKSPEDDKKVDKKILKVYLWKDLFNFENTDEKDMIIKEFDYTNDGINEGLNFVENTSIV